MRIALSAWAGQISPVFDSAEHVVFLDIQGEKTLYQINATLQSNSPIERIAELKAFGTDTLICGAVSRALAELVRGSGIRVISFVSGDVGTVLDAFLNGTLPSPELTMPGCWKRRERRRRHGRPVPAGRDASPKK